MQVAAKPFQWPQKLNLDADTLRRLSPLLDQALDLDEIQREPWLATLGAEFADLVPILRTLLDSESSTASPDWLDRPPVVTNIEPERESPDGDHFKGEHVGPFRLLREIGRGGMGDVWLAEHIDRKLKRSVALKLPTLSLRKNVLLQRFENERDILASLNHAHIAHLYDAGLSDDGQPYLALEYVEGIAINVYADTHNLTTRSCIELFMQVLDAVQYAHANLVIHRDLKPGNVLVNAQGKALLLDFGIAKILEEDSSEANESELTRLGGRALTLHYAAPEQIKGEGVSIATDIWALGVLLYELLTGLRPFDGAGRNGLEASVLNAEPIRPNSRRSGRMTELSSGLASDLDTIVLKAIKKAVPDRYATVNAFSEDLTRWLKGEAVLAQPDSRWYRTRKFVGRNRLAVLSGVVAFLLVTSTATLAIIMGLRAGEEAGRATAARDFQIDMFRQANTDLTQGEEISARQLLVQGRKTILNTLDSQPLLRNELLNGIAEAQIGIEQWADADESLTLLSAFMLASGKPRDAAMTTLDRAEGAVEKGDFARVMAILSEAQSIYPEYAADEFFLVRLLIFEVAEAHFKADQASVHELLNSVRPMAVRVLNGTDRRQLFAIRLLAEIESGVGDFLQASNRLNDLLSRLSEGKKTAPNAVLGVLDDLAQLEIYAGRFHTAMILYETANGHCAHDLDPNGRQCTLTQLHRINNLLFLGYFDDAMKALPPVLASVRFRKSTDSLGAATLQAYSTLLKNNKLDQYPDVSMHLSLLTTSGESDKSHTSIRVNGLLLEVEKLIRQQQPKNAELVLIKAENELVSNKLGYARFAARIKLFRGIIANALGNPETAISIMQEGVKILGNETGFDHPLTLMMTINQANALSRINQKEKALALIDYALPVLQDALGLTAPIFLKIKAMRAEIANSPSQKSKFQNELFFL